VIGCVAMLLGIAFEKQNVAYMISLAFGIAASSTFPLLILSIFWPGFTALGAIAGGTAGLLLSLALTILGPSIWVETLGFSQSIFPFEPPTIIAMPLAFALCFTVSWVQNYHLQVRTPGIRRLSME
jgi:cation/acetate symporter